MHIANRNTVVNAKKGNFAQRQAARLVVEAEKRVAQILFNTWANRRRRPKCHRLDEAIQEKCKASWLKEDEKPTTKKKKTEVGTQKT